ncbi:cold-regulated protein 27-like [Curcuma longa]|uniref:cold-regulated protein 27-like n=1 Tax=Curcuma longa TaxID=136217 RepID=UPI003D9DBC71
MGESDRPTAEEVLKSESPSTDSQLVGSLSNGWTDEKHILFLNDIESSFVNELYNEKYDSSAHHRWLSRMKMRKGSCRQRERDQKPGQLKVLRMGCWEDFVNDREKKDAEIETGFIPFSANPWIQHFRPTLIMKEKCLLSSDRIYNSHLENDGHDREGTSSKHNCCQGSVGSSAEASDQNFIDDELISEKRSSISRKRRLGTQAVHDSINDQLVPSEKAFVSPTSARNPTAAPCATNSESSSRSWEVDSIPVLSETKSPTCDEEEVNS